MTVVQDYILTFISAYGYIIIFLTMFLGLIGLPIPDEVIMMFAGYLISKGKLVFIFTVVIAFLGSFIGMSFSYLIGQLFGLPLIEKYGHRFFLTMDKYKKVQNWFHKFGKFAIMIGYFFPGLRHVTAYSAGVSKWSYRSFSLYALPGALVWVATFILLGFLFEDQWQQLYDEFHHWSWLVLTVLLISGGSIWWLYRRRRLIRRKSEKET